MARQKSEQRALVARVTSTQLALVTTLVESGDHRGAERALVGIADQIGGSEGDKALALTLPGIPPVSLAQILVATATQPSAIVGDLVPPKVFVKALAELTKTWGVNSAEDAKKQLGELFIGVVMRPDSKERFGREAKKFFDAMLESETGVICLLSWWLAQHGYQAYQAPREADIDDDADADEALESVDPEAQMHQELHEIRQALETEDGSWRHLVGLLREHDLHGSVVQELGVPFESLLPSVAVAVEADSTESAL